jgi:Outer membrane protein beta-barrel domain
MRTSLLIGASALVLSLSPSILSAEPPRADASAPGASDGIPSLALRSSDLYRSEAVPAASARSDGWTAGPVAAAPAPLGALTGLPTMTLAADNTAATTSYLEARAGPVFFLGDFDNLDTGFNVEGAFGVRPIPFLALEVVGGYLRGEDNGGTVEETLWCVPVVGNVKVTIPLLFFKPYAGIGVGGFYIDTEERTGPLKSTENDWVLGWNAMVGASFEVGPVMLGVEGKYIQTDMANTARGSNARLEVVEVLAAVGVRF